MTTLHRASWVVPVVSPPIKNGGVIVDNGHIVEVGELQSLTSPYAHTIDHGNGILMPGLVNAHTHSELSHYHVKGLYSSPGDMVKWIGELLASRAIDTPDRIIAIAQNYLEKMHTDGIDLIADIGNDASFARDTIKDLQVLFYHELLGLSQQVASFMAETMATGQSLYTCHAPYSTNKELLLQTKKICRAKQQIFPIHTAESQAEVDFIHSGQGAFRQFIEARGSWDGSFLVPGCSPVQYLSDLDVLDEQTLCVHCVQIDGHDLQLLSDSKTNVCICIGSNEYLGVGIPPVDKMLALGMTPCLGTDSLASNPEVSIWREMNLIHTYFPQIAATDVLKMATLHGASALGCPQYGSLAPKNISMIFVAYSGDAPLHFLAFDSSSKDITRCM